MYNLTKEQICLYIEPYIHVNVKENDILLYNTLSGDQLPVRNRPAIARFIKRMTDKRNLNALVESKSILEEEELGEFLIKAGSMEMIRWFDYTKTCKHNKKPVSIPALLNLHRDRKKMLMDIDHEAGRDIKHTLNKINLYINNYSSHERPIPFFNLAYKQFIHSYSAQHYQELTFEQIRHLIAPVANTAAFKLTVLGGNITQHSHWSELSAFLIDSKIKIEFGISLEDATTDTLKQLPSIEAPLRSIRVFIQPGFTQDRLLACRDLMQQNNITPTYQFAITCDSDVEHLCQVTDLPGMETISVKPFYNGSNLDFFKDNVFVTSGDFSETPVSKKEIYARSVMNSNRYGEITVLPDRRIFTDVNGKPIGTIDQPIQEILLKELSHTKGWFKVRKNLTPCKSCIYNQLCPPVSSYEHVLSRNNTCTIRP